MGEETWRECPGGIHYRYSFADALAPQEAVEKYQQSKRELDEVVAQMESLVSVSSCPVRTKF